MISYDQLCQTLEQYNARLRNENELSQLEQTGEGPDLNIGEEDSPGTDSRPPSHRAKTNPNLISPLSSSEAGHEGFADQLKEDTHEIDVDDMDDLVVG